MSKVSLTISQRYRYFFYSVLSLSFITGFTFWLIRRFGMVEGDFGPESHFLQYPVLQIHGFSAFILLMSLGAIFASHIPKTWSSKRARKSGVSILSATVFSILTAYSLYYLVSDDWHELLGNAHALVGVSLPLILFIHIRLARKTRKNKKNKHTRKHSRHNKQAKISKSEPHAPT